MQEDSGGNDVIDYTCTSSRLSFGSAIGLAASVLVVSSGDDFRVRCSQEGSLMQECVLASSDNSDTNMKNRASQNPSADGGGASPVKEAVPPRSVLKKTVPGTAIKKGLRVCFDESLNTWMESDYVIYIEEEPSPRLVTIRGFNTSETVISGTPGNAHNDHATLSPPEGYKDFMLRESVVDEDDEGIYELYDMSSITIDHEADYSGSETIPNSVVTDTEAATSEARLRMLGWKEGIEEACNKLNGILKGGKFWKNGIISTDDLDTSMKNISFSERKDTVTDKTLHNACIDGMKEDQEAKNDPDKNLDEVEIRLRRLQNSDLAQVAQGIIRSNSQIRRTIERNALRRSLVKCSEAKRRPASVGEKRSATSSSLEEKLRWLASTDLESLDGLSKYHSQHPEKFSDSSLNQQPDQKIMYLSYKEKHSPCRKLRDVYPPKKDSANKPNNLPQADGCESNNDELVQFVQGDLGRLARLRKRYSLSDDEDDGGFSRRPSVRGIRPRFGSTTEIIKQVQHQLHPPLGSHHTWPYRETSDDIRRNNRSSAALNSVDEDQALDAIESKYASTGDLSKIGEESNAHRIFGRRAVPPDLYDKSQSTWNSSRFSSVSVSSHVCYPSPNTGSCPSNYRYPVVTRPMLTYVRPVVWKEPPVNQRHLLLQKYATVGRCIPVYQLVTSFPRQRSVSHVATKSRTEKDQREAPEGASSLETCVQNSEAVPVPRDSSYSPSC